MKLYSCIDFFSWNEFALKLLTVSYCFDFSEFITNSHNKLSTNSYNQKMATVFSKFIYTYGVFKLRINYRIGANDIKSMLYKLRT